ncbi:MAG: NAD-dependent epimerase/dehydratase family protein [Candidatus Riflebacteria bacterium]|nr:NAD-dependent epimerase/dehydratase family protein [Candidatus Riflebacteria bacterium]
MKSCVLVTGGAGFIGSHVARHALAAGHEVVVIDDLSGGFRENVPEGARFIEGDAGDESLIEHLFNETRFTAIFHLAAYAAEGLSHFIRSFNYHNNLITSVRLINAAIKHDVEVFVFTSSIAVYGRNQLPMTEELTPAPEDPYGISKFAVELDLEAAHRLFGLNYVIFRPHNVYGTNQNLGDPYRNVIGIFMNQIMQGQPLTIFGDGIQTRAFSHIDDVAPVIARSIGVPEALGKTFNVGADTPVSVNDLAIAVMKAMGREVPIIHLPARNEVQDAFASHDRVKSIFGLSDIAVSLDRGLAEMADWAKHAGPRSGKPFEGVEIEKNLPPSWSKLLSSRKK